MTEQRLGRPQVRLFVALELPPAFLHELVAWREAAFADVDGARLVPKQNLHVTLIFLGHRYEREVEQIGSLLASEPATPFELAAEQLVAIGGPRRSGRALALSLADRSRALSTYQRRLAERLNEAGLSDLEKREFWPHLTLARGKAKQQITLPEGAESQLPGSLREPFVSRGISLFQSILHPAGARYEPLRTISLK